MKRRKLRPPENCSPITKFFKSTSGAKKETPNVIEEGDDDIEILAVVQSPVKKTAETPGNSVNSPDMNRRYQWSPQGGGSGHWQGGGQGQSGSRGQGGGRGQQGGWQQRDNWRQGGWNSDQHGGQSAGQNNMNNRFASMGLNSGQASNQGGYWEGNQQLSPSSSQRNQHQNIMQQSSPHRMGQQMGMRQMSPQQMGQRQMTPQLMNLRQMSPQQMGQRQMGQQGMGQQQRSQQFVQQQINEQQIRQRQRQQQQMAQRQQQMAQQQRNQQQLGQQQINKQQTGQHQRQQQQQMGQQMGQQRQIGQGQVNQQIVQHQIKQLIGQCQLSQPQTGQRQGGQPQSGQQQTGQPQTKQQQINSPRQVTPLLMGQQGPQKTNQQQLRTPQGNQYQSNPNFKPNASSTTPRQPSPGTAWGPSRSIVRPRQGNSIPATGNADKGTGASNQGGQPPKPNIPSLMEQQPEPSLLGAPPQQPKPSLLGSPPSLLSIDPFSQPRAASTTNSGLARGASTSISPRASRPPASQTATKPDGNLQTSVNRSVNTSKFYGRAATAEPPKAAEKTDALETGPYTAPARTYQEHRMRNLAAAKAALEQKNKDSPGRGVQRNLLKDPAFLGSPDLQRRRQSSGDSTSSSPSRSSSHQTHSESVSPAQNRRGPDREGGTSGSDKQVDTAKSTSSSSRIPSANQLLLSPEKRLHLSNLVTKSSLLMKLGSKGSNPELTMPGASRLEPDNVASNEPEDDINNLLDDLPEEKDTDTALNNRPASTTTDLSDEFDLEEIDIVPALAKARSRNFSAPDGERNEAVVEETVQKGLQNLRNMFKCGTGPVSMSAGVAPQEESGEKSKTLRRDSSQSSLLDQSGFDVDMSEPEDSDDDDLNDAPSIFKKFDELAAVNRAPISSPLTVQPRNDSESEAEPPQSQPEPVQKEEFTLDNLLTEREQLEDNDRQLALMEAELQEGIRHGGIRTFVTEESGEELMPEHQQKLKKMEVAEQVVQDHHPGEDVFQAARYRQLFSYPGNLTLESCGFKAGKSYIDKHLTTLQPALVSEMLTQEVILLCFDAISCPHAFLTWLFQLISVHPNCLVSQQAHSVMYSVLRHTDKAKDWVPDLNTIARVFVNLGADPSTLCGLGPVSVECLQGVDMENNHQGAPPDHPHQGLLQPENLRLVLQVIADAVHLRSQFYPVDHLVTIILMVLKAALDKRLCQEALNYDIQVTLSSLLNAIESNQWQEKVAELCERVPGLTSHHHNRVYLASLLPPCDRGRYLQRRIAYSALHQTLEKRAPPENVLEFSLYHLQPLLSGIRIKGDTVDYYLVSSLICLVDLAVGNEPLPSREKKDLVNLTSILKSKMGDVRESINIMDRTLVKDQMVRLTSKWTFTAQNMGSKERTIFAYTTVSEPMPIESIVTADQADDSEPEMEVETSNAG